ncbi:MAG: betC 3 [Verrucomicrobiales bacterium]|nr:betC 3 [Verrucomicrobiales bacterium]
MMERRGGGRVNSVFTVIETNRIGSASGDAIMKRLLLLGLVVICAWANSLSAATPPNLIIFIADDFSYYDLHCWGSPDARTPNLDKLASEGMKLTRCYTPAPVCSPTRMALYSGLYPIKNGGYPNHSAVKPGTKSMVHFLKPLGYRVGIVGKTMIAPKESFPFDEPQSKSAAAKQEKAWKKKGEKQDADEEGADADLDFAAIQTYMTQDKAQPFCLVVASHQPHGPWNKGDASAYKADKLTIPPYLVDTPELREERTHHLAEVTYLDDEVGRVMKLLKKSGQEENTLFLFLSEQGSGFPGGKYNLYDIGIRSAAIARWPGKIKAGSESAAISSYVDVVPTFIDAAGGKPVPCLDGRSFLGVLTGQTEHHLDYVFAQSTSLGVKGVTHPYGIRAVRDDRYKYILNLNHENEFPCSHAAHKENSAWAKLAKTDATARERLERFLHRPEVELYDLKSDPWEQKNIASDPAQGKTLARLRQQLDTWMLEQGDHGAATEMEAGKHLKKALKANKTKGEGAKKT